MSFFNCRIDLKPHLVGDFNLATLDLGYRFSPWQREDGQFCQGLLCGAQVVKVSLSAEEARPMLGIRSERELHKEQVEEIRHKVLFCLGLDEDLSGLEKVSERDPHLRRAYLALPGYRLKGTPTIAEAILSAVVSQNCSRDAFFSMLGELRERFGAGAHIADETVTAFPLPHELMGADFSEVKNPWLRCRARSIQRVASLLSEDFITRLKSSSPGEGIEELKRIKGIGDYTARVAQLYGLRRYGVSFVDGYVQKLIGKLYLNQTKPRPKEVLQFSEEKWGEWQGYALDLIIAHAQLREWG